MKKIDFKKSAETVGKALMVLIAALVIVTVLASAEAEPKITTPPSIEHIKGAMGFQVDAYTINVKGLDFLVVVNANKGGVAVTRIK